MADKRLMAEFAGISRDIFNMQLAGGVLRNLDEVLQSRASGKGLKLYDELERDAQVFAVVQKRKMAVVARPWTITPASTSLRDKKAADLIQTTFESVAFDQLCLNLLDAVLKGFAICEIMWEMQGDMLLPTRFIPRDQRRFTFDDHYAPRLLTRENMLHGETLPGRKFIVHSQGGKDGSPYGLGLGSKLYWPVLFKRQGIGFWMALGDRFGSPTAVGKYREGTPPEQQDKLLAMLESIAQDTSIVIPDTTLLELMEPKNGNVTMHEPLIRYLDEQISTAVLGETMTTTSKSSGLGSGQADVHNSVRKELSQADADLLSDTLNNTLVRWIVELNLPNALPPRVYRDFSEPEDMKARAELDQIVATMSGMKPSLKYIQETYGGEWVAAAPVPPAVAPAADNQTAAATAILTGTIDQATIDTNPTASEEDQLAASTATYWDTMLSTVKRLVDGAEDLTKLQQDLTAAYGDLPTDELVRVMAAGFALAELKGMADVSNGR